MVWIMIGYMFVLVIVILIVGWVVDWFGIRWFFMGLVLVFIFGLLLCVVVLNILLFIIFCVV